MSQQALAQYRTSLLQPWVEICGAYTSSTAGDDIEQTNEQNKRIFQLQKIELKERVKEFKYAGIILLRSKVFCKIEHIYRDMYSGQKNQKTKPNYMST